MMREFEIISRQASLNYKEQGQILKTFINNLIYHITNTKLQEKRVVNRKKLTLKITPIIWSNKYENC